MAFIICANDIKVTTVQTVSRAHDSVGATVIVPSARWGTISETTTFITLSAV
jgi:hypothetical protein